MQSNLYAYLKQELSKITMPVIFNEPLSFLQRMVEYLEYAPLLLKAVECENPTERLEVSWISGTTINHSISQLNQICRLALIEEYELVPCWLILIASWVSMGEE